MRAGTLALLAGLGLGGSEPGGYWAFQPLISAGTRRAIDEFLPPLPPEASREKLVRRVYLDVTGLPPEEAEADGFARDRAPCAWDRLVDRLMASSRYGERWATKWLDVVRYADSNGFELDADRPEAWRYRDYVVRAFNRDKPYDRFVKEQIAGDELYPGDREALLALGFLRCGPRLIANANLDPSIAREQELVEMTGPVGSTFLGLTVACARCHDHKFDPISQRDYRRLEAAFAGTEWSDIDLDPESGIRRWQEESKVHEARVQPWRDTIAAVEKPYREVIRGDRLRRLDVAHAAALAVPEASRNPAQKVLAKEAEEQIHVFWDELIRRMSPADREKRAALRRKVQAMERGKPAPPAKAFAVRETGKGSGTEAGFLAAVTGPAVPPGEKGRTALANWIASERNPLAARVMVNRIWQFRMGTGLVATPGDFGRMGGRPGNRELLDWLAGEFVKHGWRVKYIDRLILTSRAYRQRAGAAGGEPRYDRKQRRRMDAEMLRDAVLAISGRLNLEEGGPPVRVPLEPEVYGLIFTAAEPDDLWPVAEDTRQYDRRSLYLMNKRGLRLPLLANFDQPDAMTPCAVRTVSTHALQALAMMNSGFTQEQSRRLADRLQRACGSDRDCQMRLAYKLVLSRAPRAEEMALDREFRRADPSLEDFCLAMLNRTEFVYVP